MGAETMSLAQVAAELSLSPKRFHAVWRAYVLNEGLPAPFRHPPGSNFAWDRELVLDWKRRRSTGDLAIQAAPANDPGEPRRRKPARPKSQSPDDERFLRERAAIAGMLRRH